MLDVLQQDLYGYIHEFEVGEVLNAFPSFPGMTETIVKALAECCGIKKSEYIVENTTIYVKNVAVNHFI
jgi:hypothetical protein